MLVLMRSLSLALLLVGASGEAVELNGKNWLKKVHHKNRAAFVKFLAPW